MPTASNVYRTKKNYSTTPFGVERFSFPYYKRRIPLGFISHHSLFWGHKLWHQNLLPWENSLPMLSLIMKKLVWIGWYCSV